MATRILPLFASVLLCSFMLIFTGSGSAAPTVRSVLVARDRTEPVVAIDPGRPSTVVVQTNTNYNAPIGDELPTGYYVSRDGGITFQAGAVPMLRPYTTGADPSVAIARNGTQYYAYLGETPSYCQGGHSAVLVSRSIDGGRSLRAPTLVDSNPADDKPNMAVQSVAGRDAHIFVSWNRDSNNGTQIAVARSINGGVSFSDPNTLYSTAGDSFGSVPLVGPRGEVYVLWSVFAHGSPSRPVMTQIYLRSSHDNGVHFGPARIVATAFRGVPHIVRPGQLRVLPTVAATVDRLGVLSVAWATVSRSYSSGAVDADIVVGRSSNGGKTWSAPRRLNNVRRGDRFFPAMTVLSDGSLGIAFYDRRANRSDLDMYAVRASFRHGFHASANIRLNSRPSHVSDIFYIAPGSTCFAGGRFFGDYIGVAAGGSSTLAVTWTDTSLQTYRETDIWYAQVNLPPA